MKILVYLGYQKIPVSPSLIESGGLGGTERACLHIAKGLSLFGWHVVVSGQVEKCNHEGVEWLPTEEVHKKYFNEFDVIIAASYIHASYEFEEYDAKKIFWAHNTDFHPWYRGEEIPYAETLIPSFDKLVCLTDWHKNQWADKYMVPHNKIHVIGNGIDPSTFYGHPQKKKDLFIWSSAPDRGLDQLLANWSSIKAIKPAATLEIYSPSYAVASEETYGRDGLEGVKFMGSVSQETLHSAMLRAEYWLYLTDYQETYCITALEMQYARVLPIVTSVAALQETVHSGIILEMDETVWQKTVQLLNLTSTSLKESAVQQAHDWARMQTWQSRAYDWKHLIEEICA